MWQRQRRARGDEERIQQVVVAVQRGVARDELQLDDVAAGGERSARDHDVAVGDDGRHVALVGAHGADAIRGLREIERHRTVRVPERKANRHAAAHGLVPAGGNPELRVVLEV